MHGMHVAISKVENSAQFLSCLQKCIHGYLNTMVYLTKKCEKIYAEKVFF
jgi:hypothetical protein